MSVTVYDIRPLQAQIPELKFIQSDATDLPEVPTESITSLSSLNAAEHFGLGRYGDPVDPTACFRFMATLTRILKPGGYLYFAVPIGLERLEFNAHRVFAPSTVLSAFQKLDLVSFAAVDDFGVFRVVADPSEFVKSRLACGLFEFRKPSDRNWGLKKLDV
jgi:SAM-dependent methyltransferase